MTKITVLSDSPIVELVWSGEVEVVPRIGEGFVAQGEFHKKGADDRRFKVIAVSHILPSITFRNSCSRPDVYVLVQEVVTPPAEQQ